MNEEPAWTIVDQRPVYQGRVKLVEHQVELPDGHTTSYEVDESLDFAVAVLVYDGELVTLARQYRHPLGCWTYDLPGGAGDGGESPAQTAARELEEELGLVAHDLRPLHTYAVNPGRAAWPVHIFTCSATDTGQRLGGDPTEQVRQATMPLAELDALIARGEIVDPTLLIARLMAAASGFMPPVTPGAPNLSAH